MTNTTIALSELIEVHRQDFDLISLSLMKMGNVCRCHNRTKQHSVQIEIIKRHKTQHYSRQIYFNLMSCSWRLYFINTCCSEIDPNMLLQILIKDQGGPNLIVPGLFL